MIAGFELDEEETQGAGGVLRVVNQGPGDPGHEEEVDAAAEVLEGLELHEEEMEGDEGIQEMENTRPGDARYEEEEGWISSEDEGTDWAAEDERVWRWMEGVYGDSVGDSMVYSRKRIAEGCREYWDILDRGSGAVWEGPSQGEGRLGSADELILSRDA